MIGWVKIVVIVSIITAVCYALPPIYNADGTLGTFGFKDWQVILDAANTTGKYVSFLVTLPLWRVFAPYLDAIFLVAIPAIPLWVLYRLVYIPFIK